MAPEIGGPGTPTQREWLRSISPTSSVHGPGLRPVGALRPPAAASTAVGHAAGFIPSSDGQPCLDDVKHSATVYGLQALELARRCHRDGDVRGSGAAMLQAALGFQAGCQPQQASRLFLEAARLAHCQGDYLRAFNYAKTAFEVAPDADRPCAFSARLAMCASAVADSGWADVLATAAYRWASQALTLRDDRGNWALLAQVCAFLGAPRAAAGARAYGRAAECTFPAMPATGTPVTPTDGATDASRVHPSPRSSHTPREALRDARGAGQPVRSGASPAPSGTLPPVPEVAGRRARSARRPTSGAARVLPSRGPLAPRPAGVRAPRARVAGAALAAVAPATSARRAAVHAPTAWAAGTGDEDLLALYGQWAAPDLA